MILRTYLNVSDCSSFCSGNSHDFWVHSGNGVGAVGGGGKGAGLVAVGGGGNGSQIKLDYVGDLHFASRDPNTWEVL
jgi:hypothetical protein